MDHPAVHASFFRFVDKLRQWYDQKRPGLPAQSAAAFDRDIEKFFGLQQSEWQAMLVVSRQVAADTNAADLAIAQHANARARFELPPVPAVVKPLIARREQAVADGIARLQQRLSPQGWGGVHGFMNGAIRGTFQQPPGR